MAYELDEDLLQRKEFNWFIRWNIEQSHVTENTIPRFLIEDAIEKSGNLRLIGYQQFIRNFLSPNTPYKRLFMQWQTGTGKTIGALSVAMNFIETYRKEIESGHLETGTVYIIGFSERVFKNELLRYPEFGFLNRKERKNLEQLRKLANRGVPDDVQKYQELLTNIKKKFTNREGNGFFKFYGYKAFVNRILDIPKNMNISNMSESQIMEAIAEEKIKYNEELIQKFKNSIIICDEIHNVYNSLEKNNWGIAIQAVLNKEPTCRALFMSATPINNSPTEIVDLLNLLNDPEDRIKKDDLFDKKAQTDILKPNALQTIAKLSKGKISFLQDLNPKYYPKIEFVGQSIPSVSHMKFIRCPMVDLQYKTYKQVYQGSLTSDSIYLLDICLPNPSSTSIGLYQTKQIKNELSSAPQEWKDKHGFDFIGDVIVGDGLKYDRLKKYSNKYPAMLDEISSILNSGGGKIFIYHNIVHMSGVLFIEQVLLANGILDENSPPSDNTLCVCGKTRKQHKPEEIMGGGEDAYIEASNKDITIPGIGKILYHKGEFFVLQENISQSLVNCNKSTLNEFLAIIQPIADKYRVVFKLLKSALRLTDWLKLSKFYEYKATHKYIYLENRERTNESNNQSILNETTGGKEQTIDINHINQYIERQELGNDNYNDDIYRDDDIKEGGGDDQESDDGKGYIQEGDSDDKGYNQESRDENEEDNNQSQLDEFFSPSGKDDEEDLASIPFIAGWQKSGKYEPQTPTLYQILSSLPYSSRIKQGGAGPTVNQHIFKPVRFIMAHSNIDKASLEHSLELYNSPENSFGHNFMILVGSKIIKESYDLKAIQHVLIMSRPDNISTFIQIRGRAIRKNSHIDLPLDLRKTRILVFVSSLTPREKALSYEELKWKDKVDSFAIIQKIEKVLHENAIDAVTNKDLIKNSLSYGDEFTPLPFNIPKPKEIPLSKLNLSTYNVYHRKTEIDLIKFIIKRLFIEISPCWKRNDLFKAIRAPPENYENEINTSLFSEENFNIALYDLVWQDIPNEIDIHQDLPDENPRFIKGIEERVVDKLFDSTDKIITLPQLQDSVVVSVGEYYILFPYNHRTNKPDVDIETPYRIIKSSPLQSINMNEFIRNKQIDFDYDDKKKIFYRKYSDTSIEHMENVICEYGLTFHIKFLEECIEYVFRAWTDPTIIMHEYHDFYFKMLYYYDLFSLVVWAYTTKPRVFQNYTKYAIPVRSSDIKLKVLNKYEKRKEEIEDISPEETSDMASSGIINMLKSSINRTSNVWLPQEFRENFDKTLADVSALFIGNKKKSKTINKTPGDKLPIGHFISKFPKLYHPERGWTEDPSYIQSEQTFIENDIIIGYDDKAVMGVHVKFKLRKPIHNITKYKDSRLIEKGTVCKSKSKEYLLDVCKKLDITVPSKAPVEELCMLIRSKLIRLELKERIKKTKIKWFYHFYEEKRI